MKILLLLLFSLLATATSGESLSEEQAFATACKFFQNDQQSTTRSSQLYLVWDGEDFNTRSISSQPAFYVYNRGENQGFVIVSASRSTKPILGFSYSGHFSIDQMPSNIKTWMRNLRHDIQTIQRLKLTPSEQVKKAWATVQVEGEEKDLGTPNWDQDAPYNLFCPMAYGRHTYTGCAVTAACIVMGYHQWPKEGVGTLPAYTTSTYQQHIEATQLGESYHWEKMPYIGGNPLDETNVEQGEAVSKLMFHVGVMARADFTISATSASLRTICDRMPTYMKYSPSTQYYRRKEFTDPAWIKMLREEIDAQRPVIYEGFDENNMGHAFVLDGYKGTEYFNVNWGWSGYCNGFFLLSDLAPMSQGIGGNQSGTFNLLQGAIVGMQPRDESSSEKENLQFIYSSSFADGIETYGMVLPVKKGDHFYVDAGLVRNLGVDVFNGYFSLAMTDADGKIIETYTHERVTNLMPASNALGTSTNSVITINEEVKAGYRLRLLYQADLSDVWRPVKCAPSIGQWEVLLNDAQPEEKSLEEMSSLCYHLSKQEIEIRTADGVSVKVKEKTTSKDYNHTLTSIKEGFLLDVKQLGKGQFNLELQRKDEKISLDLRF